MMQQLPGALAELSGIAAAVALHRTAPQVSTLQGVVQRLLPLSNTGDGVAQADAPLHDPVRLGDALRALLLPPAPSAPSASTPSAEDAPPRPRPAATSGPGESAAAQTAGKHPGSDSGTGGAGAGGSMGAGPGRCLASAEQLQAALLALLPPSASGGSSDDGSSAYDLVVAALKKVCGL